LKDETEGEHSFIAASTFDSANKTDFYEVLAESKTGYTFVRSIQTSLERKNTSDAEKILKNEGQDEYTDKYTYYVSFKNAKPVLVDMKRKKLSAAFAPEMKIVIDNYLSSHRNDDIDYRFIIKMVTSINQQYYL
jgi:hypothetical protein